MAVQDVPESIHAGIGDRAEERITDEGGAIGSLMMMAVARQEVTAPVAVAFHQKDHRAEGVT